MAENEDNLTGREIEVLQLIADGLTDAKIANRLSVTIHAIKASRKVIRGKMGGGNSAHLVAKGFRRGYIS